MSKDCLVNDCVDCKHIAICKASDLKKSVVQSSLDYCPNDVAKLKKELNSFNYHLILSCGFSIISLSISIACLILLL